MSATMPYQLRRAADKGKTAELPGPLEIPPVAFVSWYVLVGSVSPAHALAAEVGDPFPAYALQPDTYRERARAEEISAAIAETRVSTGS